MASFNGDGINHVLVEVSPDIHICGFCKQQYNNFEVFLAHKQNGCQIPSTDISTPSSEPSVTESSTEFVFEEAFQTSRGVKKTLTKAQKTPSKKLKPALSPKRHICYFSGCTFKTQYGQKDMERHILTHTGERPFECELCHKRFSRRDKLNLHSRSHTGEKPHKCKYCTYAAADSSSLKKHLRIHYDERPFKCQICPYASRNSSQLTVHLRSHTGDAPFQCNQCNAKFKINSDLKRHSRVHSGEKPFKCDMCEYRCAMKANLKSHIQLKHSTADTYRCAQCDFQCATKAELRYHSRQHQPTQPLQCSKCSYSCSSKGALKIHERIHSDERPFKCEHCSFASKQRSNLLIHKRKCHADKPDRAVTVKAGSKGGGSGGEEVPKPLSSRYRARLEAARAFRCDLCEASFVREDSLRSHKRQHNTQQQGILRVTAVAQPQAVANPNPSVQASGQVRVPLVTEPLSSYSSTHLKIIVAPPLGPEGSFVQAAVDLPQGKAGAVLLGAEGQDMLLNPVIQQVNLLTPVQHMVPPPGGALEHQTVLLTHIAPSEDSPVHQTLLQTTDVTPQTTDSTQTFISSCSDHQTADNSHTFITACSDLDGLNALIQEGGTEVTVVTEGNPVVTATTEPPFGPPLDCPASQDMSKQASPVGPDPHAPCDNSDLVMSSLSMGQQGALLIHNVPLAISTQDRHAALDQLSPRNLFSDSNTGDGAEE
ncbi:zinc finger protein 64 [Chanos chanos]|uniref:Zinc finger protein 64 n=1 Tax=Chanos chanos TaxID=29144 RepID=A0A6J2UWK9_CHACN|nr:zinc finger protein 64 [Chanos chanos]